MTPPFRSDPARQAAAPPTSPPPFLDEADELWGCECSLAYLQGGRRPAGVWD